MILRGQIIHSAYRSLKLCADTLEAEVQACVEGIELALLYTTLPIVINTDCARLVSAVKDPSPD
jgi:hypothetical protein